MFAVKYASKMCQIQACNRLQVLKQIHQKTYHLNSEFSPQSVNLGFALSEAERLVGYSTTFLSRRWLQSDEISSVLPLLNKLKLEDSNHSLEQFIK